MMMSPDLNKDSYSVLVKNHGQSVTAAKQDCKNFMYQIMKSNSETKQKDCNSNNKEKDAESLLHTL